MTDEPEKPSTLPFTIRRPVVFFDLETTGLDYKYDRIIEIGAIKIHPDGRTEKFHLRLNPEMRIPAEVVELTGITNEDASTCPTFSRKAPEITSFFSGADLGGYHVGRFDAKIMVAVMPRCRMP